jgi:hypothetical protein
LESMTRRWQFKHAKATMLLLLGAWILLEASSELLELLH